MLIRRQVTRQQRQRNCVCTMGSSGMHRTVCSFDIHYVHNPVLPSAFSSSRLLPSSAARRIVKARLPWRITSGLCFTSGHPKRCVTLWCSKIHFPPFIVALSLSFFIKNFKFLLKRFDSKASCNVLNTTTWWKFRSCYNRERDRWTIRDRKQESMIAGTCNNDNNDNNYNENL